MDELGIKAGETAAKKKQREGKLDTPLKRQYAFNDAVREGHGKFHCVCCQRIRNRRSIVEYTEDLAQTITNIHPTIIERTIGILNDSDRVDGKHYICKVYRDKVKNNKIPAVCHKNNLELSEHQTEMTQLARACIAQNLIFQYIVQLPKSRWAATHSKIFNVPVFEQDIKDTLEKIVDAHPLPRFHKLLEDINNCLKINKLLYVAILVFFFSF